MDDAELVGGVLLDAADPNAAARALADLLTQGETDRAAARSAGLDPDLVVVLANRFRSDHARIQNACSLGTAWVRPPIGDRRRALGARRLTTFGYAATRGPASHYRRDARPARVGVIAHASRGTVHRLARPLVPRRRISAATARGVSLQVLLPTRSTHASEALQELEDMIRREGDIARYSRSALRTDAPWAHLKVLSADCHAAYIGSANVTGAGISGPNLSSASSSADARWQSSNDSSTPSRHDLTMTAGRDEKREERSSTCSEQTRS